MNLTEQDVELYDTAMDNYIYLFNIYLDFRRSIIINMCKDESAHLGNLLW